MKKNILYIFNDISLGGAALSLWDILTEIKKYINPVVVMRESINDEAGRKFEELGIRCYKIRFLTDYVPVGEVTRGKKEEEFRQSYEAALQLIPIIRKENVELIHINSSVSYFAALAALMMNIPYVWHIRELMEEQFGCEFLNNELKHELYIEADKLIAISNFVSQKYHEKYFITTTKIYNGLNVEKLRLCVDRNRDLKKVFLAAAAMISTGKGQLDAIKAVEILIGRGYTDVRLIIVGGGKENYIWALKKYVKKKKIGGFISILPFQSDLTVLRRNASYELVCSQNEALGRVTIEAMLAGNFVIGARSGGTIEIIGENEERGYLYELHNSEDLADAMIRAMKTPQKEKSEIVKKAQRYAEETFELRKYCNEMLLIYDKVIKSFEPRNRTVFLQKIKERYELIRDKRESNCQVSGNQLLKLQAAFSISVMWIEMKQKGYNLAEFFMRHKIQSIAIYGMAVLGRLLYDELEDSGIKIKYLIDQEPDFMNQVLEFVPLEEKVLVVDAIVVTVAGTEKKIVEEIRSMGYENVIGLSDIIDSFER